jgi:hypothetical protein
MNCQKDKNDKLKKELGEEPPGPKIWKFKISVSFDKIKKFFRRIRNVNK